MSTPSIAPRATDHTLEAQARAAESSCCSILIKTALTVAIVAAAAIAFTVTLACASPLIGLVVLCVALPITAIFLSATWAGHTTHMTYSPPRHYAPVRTPSPAFFGAPPRHFFSEPASASRFGQPAAAAFADRPFESVWGLPRRGLEFGQAGAVRRTDFGMPAAAAAPRTAVGGVDLSMPALRVTPAGGHVGVGSRR